MCERYNLKNVLVVLIIGAVILFALGASRYNESQSNGRFQLVVRHTNTTDAYVIDTATGQVWSNKVTSEEGRRAFYNAKLLSDLQSN